MANSLALFILTATLLALPLHAQNHGHKVKGVRAGWAACDVVGATVPLAVKAPGDLATLALPSRYAKVPLVSVLATVTSLPLTGLTITATVAIECSAGAVYSVSSTGGWAIPPNMRVYFSTVPGPYKFGNADLHDTLYWWSDVAFDYLTLDNINGLASPETFTFTAPLDPAQWSDANGHRATESPAYTAAFLAAADHPAQAGFSFGSGNFFDTGVGAWVGAITLHVLAFDAQ